MKKIRGLRFEHIDGAVTCFKARVPRAPESVVQMILALKCREATATRGTANRNRRRRGDERRVFERADATKSAAVERTDEDDEEEEKCAYGRTDGDEDDEDEGDEDDDEEEKCAAQLVYDRIMNTPPVRRSDEEKQ